MVALQSPAVREALTPGANTLSGDHDRLQTIVSLGCVFTPVALCGSVPGCPPARFEPHYLFDTFHTTTQPIDSVAAKQKSGERCTGLGGGVSIEEIELTVHGAASKL